MNNDSSFKRHATCRAGLAVTLALLAGVPACGDLDETDSDPPSVDALALWDSSHLVAVRTYHKDPVIVDLQTGKQTRTLSSDTYYSDIAVIGNGEFVCLQNQSIDFFRSDGTRDADRSIPGALFSHMTVSADRSTLAYGIESDPTTNTIGIVDLPGGGQSFLSPDVAFNLGTSLSISRDGKLVAFANGDVGVAATHAPAATSMCALALDPRHPGSALATAFSPVDDKLAASMVDGDVNVFDLAHFPDCTLVSSYLSPEDDPSTIQHMAFSPDGSVLAISVEQSVPSPTAGVFVMTGAIRLVDPAAGTALAEWPVYRWEMTPDGANAGPLVTDLQWSDAGDRIAVSTSNGPIQQWDVASSALLWSASL